MAVVSARRGGLAGRRTLAATLALATGFLAGPPAPAHAEDQAACARDVLIANSMQRQAIDQLESAEDNDTSRCRVWRRHIDTMRRLAGVYGRCLSGPERKQRLSEVQGSESEFSGLVRSRCKGL